MPQHRHIPIQFINSVLQNDLNGIETYIQQGIDLNQRYDGLTALDLALIYNQNEAVSLLRMHAAAATLTSEGVAEMRQQLFRDSHLETRMVFKIAFDDYHRPELAIQNYRIEGNEFVSGSIISFNYLNEVGYAQGNLRVISANGEPCLGVFDTQNSARLKAVLKLSVTGELTLVTADSKNSALSIESNEPVILEGNIDLNELVINAKSIQTTTNSRIQLNTVDVTSQNNITFNGTLISETLKLQASSFENIGQTIITKEFDIHSRGRVEQRGELISGKNGNIHAHSIENHIGALTQASEGDLKLHGSSFIKNNGSLIANYLVLDSDILVNNYAGALIKAINCILPPATNQFNNAGICLIGRKTNMSTMDKLLNWSGAAVEIGSALSLAPVQTIKNLRLAILVSKTLYRASGILQKLYNGNGDAASQSELVSFFLDNVIPSMGMFSNNEAKSEFLRSVLYQIWGWYLGEQACIDKSLSFIEMVARGAALYSEGKLSRESVEFLQDFVKKIQYSKQGIKYTRSALEYLSGVISDDDTEKDNAKQTFWALSESIFRDLLQTIKPEKIFDIELNPKDLALFVLNRGYTQSIESNVKRTVYSLIYAMKKSDKISDEEKSVLQLCTYSAFASADWYRLMQAYEQGRLSYTNVVNQTLSLISTAASFKVTHDQFRSKDVVSETETDAELEEAQAKTKTVEESPEQNADLAVEDVVDDVSSDVQPIPSEEEIKQTTDANAASVLVEYEKKQINFVLDLHELVEDKVMEYSGQSSDELPMGSRIASVCHELQRAIDGDYAAEGYLGVFANTLHNDGVLDTIGGIQFSVETGHNSNSVRATGDISLYGKDFRSAELSEVAPLSSFTNDEQGFFTSRNALRATNIGSFHNAGAIQTESEIEIGVRSFTNLSGASVTSKENDVNIQADGIAHNAGHLSGYNVKLEGIVGKSTNSGTMMAKDLATMASGRRVDLEKGGKIIAKRAHLNGPTIDKSGSIHAAFAKTNGYETEKPENIIWHTAEDRIHAAVLNPSAGFEYDPDAFNTTNVTDLQLSYAQLGEGKLLNLSPDFQGTLQVQLPSSERVFTPGELPLLGNEATFALIAPGSTLDATQGNFNYQSALYYQGESFQHSGQNTFLEGHFDVQDFEGIGGTTKLTLPDGGTIQAHNFSNEGHLDSGGKLHWNVDHFQNDAQLSHYLQSFTHSWQTPSTDYHYAAALVPNSGTITSKAHVGYIGEFNQYGGTFTSGKDGNGLYIENSNQQPIFTQKGIYTQGHIEECGMSWHIMPESHNSVIGSSAVNTLLGTGKFTGTGVTVYGDEGNHVHFNQGVDIEHPASYFYVIQEAWKKKHGKKDVTVEAKNLTVYSKSEIICNEPNQLSIASAEGDILLRNTIISNPGDVSLIAKKSIKIDGQEVTQTQHSKTKKKGLLHYKKVTSETETTHIECSFIFVGGTLRVSCLDFQLSAVQGVMGNADVVALNTTLKGQTEHMSNTTKTKEFNVGLPTDNLVSLLSDHNARSIFSAIVKNSGWNPADLEALSKSDNVEDLPLNLLSTAQGTWNLTALAAKACNQVAGGSASEYMGSVTDQLGLTTLNSDGNRVINTNASFKFTKTTSTTERSSVVATDLFVGGTFRLVGSTLQISDGSKIDAKHLVLSLAKGIEMTCGVETYDFRSSTKSVSLGVNLLNPEDVSVGVEGSKSHIHSEKATLASLNARDSADIRTGEYIRGEGKITASSGNVSAPEISLSSVQDSYVEENKSYGLNVSTSVTPSTDMLTEGNFSAHYNQNKTDRLTTSDKAGVFLDSGKVETNQCHLGNGAIISATEFARLDGEEGLPTVTSTDAYDHDTSKQSGASLKSSSSKPGGTVGYSSSKDKTVQHASIYADNVDANSFAGINTDRDKETEVLMSKKSGAKLDSDTIDFEKIKNQGKEILEAGKHIKDFASDVFAESAKTLHFAYEPKKTPTSSFSDVRPTVEVSEILSPMTAPVSILTPIPAPEPVQSNAPSAPSPVPPSQNASVSNPGRRREPYSTDEEEGTYDNSGQYNDKLSELPPDIEYIDGKLNINIYPLPQNEQEQEQAQPKKKFWGHEPFHLPSGLSDTHENRFASTLIGIGRGIEIARDAAVDAFIHPIDTAADFVVTSFDGFNAFTDLTLGISTEGSRERNRNRGEAFHDSLEKVMDGTDFERAEVLSNLAAGKLFGAITGGLPRSAVITPLMEHTGQAIRTRHGYAYQDYSKPAREARKAAKEGAPLYRIGDSKDLIKRDLTKEDGQYWAFEKPVTSSYAERHGIPHKNILEADFAVEAVLIPNSKFITRPAAGVGFNKGGAMEVVTNPKSVNITNESLTIAPQIPGTGSKIGAFVEKSINTVGSEYVLGALQPETSENRRNRGMSKQ